MNVKSFIFILFVGTHLSFTIAEVPSLQDTIGNSMFSSKNWKHYQALLIKEKDNLPKEVW